MKFIEFNTLNGLETVNISYIMSVRAHYHEWKTDEGLRVTKTLIQVRGHDYLYVFDEYSAVLESIDWACEHLVNGVFNAQRSVGDEA